MSDGGAEGVEVGVEVGDGGDWGRKFRGGLERRGAWLGGVGQFLSGIISIGWLGLEGQCLSGIMSIGWLGLHGVTRLAEELGSVKFPAVFELFPHTDPEQRIIPPDTL